MLKRVIDRLNPYETTLETCAAATYELGDMVKCFLYAQRYKEPNYQIEAKIALSDLIAQCILICEREGWDFADVKVMGIERFIEKVERHIEKGE